MSEARVVARLDGDGSGFERMLVSASAKAESFGSNVVGGLKAQLAGLFAIGAIEEGIRSVINYSGHIHDLAKQADITTDEVQRIGYAAKEIGLEFEDFQTALSKVGAARRSAAENNDEMLAGFKRFGVTLEDLQNPALRNVDLMYKMADAMKSMDLDASDRQTLRDFFGKSGDKLAEGIANIDKFKDRPIVSQKDIESINKLQKAIDKLITTAKVAASGPIAAQADNLSEALDPKTSLANRAKALLRFAQNFTLGGGVVTGFLSKNLAESSTGINPDAAHSPSSPSRASLIGGGALFTDKRGIEAEQLKTRLDEIAYQNALKLLTPYERRISLLKEINALLGAANVMSQLTPNDQRAALHYRIKAEEKIGELESIKQPKIPNDSLVRVGNFIGAGAQNIPTIQDKIVRENTNALRDLNRNLAALGVIIKTDTGFNPLGGNPLGVPPA